MYQIAVVIVYVLAYWGLLEIWPVLLHFHYADIKLSLLWEVPIRAAVMPFFLSVLLSEMSRNEEGPPLVALAVAPAITLLLNSVFLEARFDWQEIVVWIVAGACSVAGAWTISYFAFKRNVLSTNR
jgi:hypothetical protein